MNRPTLSPLPLVDRPILPPPSQSTIFGRSHVSRRERLVPVEKAIALKERAVARHASATTEGDAGAALMRAAFDATPTTLPTRYPESELLLQLHLTLLAEIDELARPKVLRAGVKLAAEKGAIGKQLEEEVRHLLHTALGHVTPLHPPLATCPPPCKK